MMNLATGKAKVSSIMILRAETCTFAMGTLGRSDSLSAQLQNEVSCMICFCYSARLRGNATVR